MFDSKVVGVSNEFCISLVILVLNMPVKFRAILEPLLLKALSRAEYSLD
ncbi:MAG: hypothetical protein ACTSYO_06405 [Candidatus Ranarchaeia archaeon]